MSHVFHAVCLLYASLVVGFVSQSAEAAIYQYHPSSPLHLGGGFDPTKPFELMLPCVQYDGTRNIDTQGATKTLFSLSLVRSRQELFKHLQVSANLSARYYFFSGEGGFSLDDESTFQSDSLTWIVKAGSDYGRYIPVNPRLTPEAQGFLQSGDHEAFSRRCGTEVVLEERKGAMVAAVFSVETLSQENKRRLEASFKGGLSLPVFDLSVSTEYKDFYRFASTMGKMKMDVFAIGGSGVTSLKDLVSAKPYDLAKVSQVLADYTGSLTPERAVPIEYLTTSMERFGWRGTSLTNLLRESILSLLFHQYRDIEATTRRLDRTLRNSEDLTEEQIKTYRNQFSEYLNALQLIRQAALDCDRESEKCTVPENTLSVVAWPKTKSAWDLCDRERTFAHKQGLIDAAELRLMQNRNLAPVYKIPGDRTTGIEGWYSCVRALELNGFNRELNKKGRRG